MNYSFFFNILSVYLITSVQGMAQIFIYEGSIVSAGSDGDRFSVGDDVYLSYELDYSVIDASPISPNYGLYPNATLSLMFYHPESEFRTHFSGGQVTVFYNRNPSGVSGFFNDELNIYVTTEVTDSDMDYMGYTDSSIDGNEIVATAFTALTNGSLSMLNDDSLPTYFLDAQEFTIYLYTDAINYIALDLSLDPLVESTSFDLDQLYISN